jgi:hypothetical protein
MIRLACGRNYSPDISRYFESASIVYILLVIFLKTIHDTPPAWLLFRIITIVLKKELLDCKEMTLTRRKTREMNVEQ